MMKIRKLIKYYNKTKKNKNRKEYGNRSKYGSQKYGNPTCQYLQHTFLSDEITKSDFPEWQ